MNFTEHLLIIAATVTGIVSISVFASLVDIPVSDDDEDDDKLFFWYGWPTKSV